MNDDEENSAASSVNYLRAPNQMNDKEENSAASSTSKMTMKRRISLVVLLGACALLGQLALFGEEDIPTGAEMLPSSLRQHQRQLDTDDDNDEAAAEPVVSYAAAEVLRARNITIKGMPSANPDQQQQGAQPHLRQRQHLPKIVHQSYKTTDLPPKFNEFRQQCIDLNPDWEFKLWTDDDNRALVKEHYPALLEVYDGYDVNIKRIDMVRYLYLHKHGGVYMDLDMTCLQPFDSADAQQFIDKPPYFAAANEKKTGAGPPSFANAFMMSTPHHPVLERILRALPQAAVEQKDVLHATGPGFLTRQLRRGKRSDFRPLPMELIYGELWDNFWDPCRSIEECKKKFPRSVTVTFWTRSWTDNPVNLDTLAPL